MFRELVQVTACRVLIWVKSGGPRNNSLFVVPANQAV